MVSVTKSMKGNANSLIEEMMTLKTTIEVAIGYGFQKVEFETDSELLIKMMNNNSKNHTEECLICQSMKKKFKNDFNTARVSHTN